MSLWFGIAALSALGAGENAVLPGTVTISMAVDPATNDADSADFSEAVGRALAGSDYLVLPAAGPSRYRARVAIEHETHGMVAATRGVTGRDIGVANWGGGMRIALPTRKQDLRALVVTRMTITLVDGRDGRMLWRGSAVTAQPGGTPGNSAPVVGSKLAEALVSQIPNVLEESLSVP